MPQRPVRHHQHGARRLTDQLVGHAAEQEPPHEAMPVRAEHDHVGAVLVGVADDFVGRRADLDGGGHARGIERMTAASFAS